MLKRDKGDLRGWYGIRDTLGGQQRQFLRSTPITDLYALLEDAQDSRTHISQRVTMDSHRVNLLIEDRIAHQETLLIVDEDAYASPNAWLMR
ncbi:hypothetical protein Tco_1553442 [Tanacetum coccineum]